MKNILLILILFYCQDNFLSAQLMKSFDNKKEWQISWKVWEHGLEIKNYETCAIYMDSLLKVTNTPDKFILSTGLKCYGRLGEIEKAMLITEQLYGSGYISSCDDSVFAELLNQTCDRVEVIENPNLKAQLIDMLIVDQYYREFSTKNELVKLGYKTHHDSLLNYNMIGLDSLNQMKLKTIFNKHGYPTKAMVGKLALQGVHFILQHSDRDIAFQKKYLPQIKKMAENGEIIPEQYGFLLDRILINEGKSQIYGTQQVPEEIKPTINYKPMKNPKMVNERRMKLGMMPIEYYLKLHFGG